MQLSHPEKFRVDYAGSPVPLVRLSLDLGSIYTPEDLSRQLYLYTSRSYLSHAADDKYVLLPSGERADHPHVPDHPQRFQSGSP